MKKIIGSGWVLIVAISLVTGQSVLAARGLAGPRVAPRQAAETVRTSACMPALYGDVNVSGAVDLDDLLCTLYGFSGDYQLCAKEFLDISPCGGGDGTIDLDDILSILGTLSGDPPCDEACLPCVGNLSPVAQIGSADDILAVLMLYNGDLPCGPICPDGDGDTTPPPVADAGRNQEIPFVEDQGDVLVTLDGRASFPDALIISYEWREGTTLLGTGEEITLPFSPGHHIVTLTVKNQAGQEDSDRVAIIYTNPNVDTTPVANAGADQTLNLLPGHNAVVVNLEGRNSYDEDNLFMVRYDTGSGGTHTALGTEVYNFNSSTKTFNWIAHLDNITGDAEGVAIKDDYVYLSHTIGTVLVYDLYGSP